MGGQEPSADVGDRPVPVLDVVQCGGEGGRCVGGHPVDAVQYGGFVHAILGRAAPPRFGVDGSPVENSADASPGRRGPGRGPLVQPADAAGVIPGPVEPTDHNGALGPEVQPSRNKRYAAPEVLTRPWMFPTVRPERRSLDSPRAE